MELLHAQEGAVASCPSSTQAAGTPKIITISTLSDSFDWRRKAVVTEVGWLQPLMGMAEQLFG